MIVRSIHRPCQIERLVRTQKGCIETVLYIHLCSFKVEVVDTGCIFTMIPVDKELGIALVTELKALEPARIAVVRHERWRILSLEFRIGFPVYSCLGE